MIRMTTDLHISRPVRLLMAACALALFLVTVALPMLRDQQRLETAIERVRSEYLDAVILSQRYTSLSQDGANRESALLEEPLFTYVERVTRSLDLTDKVGSVTPENMERDDGTMEESVLLSFKGITLDGLVRFLYHVEVQKQEIAVRSLSLRKDTAKNLDVQMTLRKLGRGEGR